MCQLIFGRELGRRSLIVIRVSWDELKVLDDLRARFVYSDRRHTGRSDVRYTTKFVRQ